MELTYPSYSCGDYQERTTPWLAVLTCLALLCIAAGQPTFSGRLPVPKLISTKPTATNTVQVVWFHANAYDFELQWSNATSTNINVLHFEGLKKQAKHIFYREIQFGVGSGEIKLRAVDGDKVSDWTTPVGVALKAE